MGTNASESGSRETHRGKSIYTTDYSSKRPGFQLHLQKARGFQGSRHHPPVPKKPDRKTMRAHQTGNYLNFKEDFERALSSVNTDKPRDFRLNVDITTPDGSRSAATHSDKALLQKFIHPTLELVEEAWRGEATSTKRSRDRLYGLAGQKISLHSRPEKQEAKKPPVMPGVNNWLRSSNEYEKAVVHNFMDTLMKASSNPVPMRPTALKPEEKKTLKPQFSKELYFQQRAKSARSQRMTERPSLPPRPKSVGSMRDEEKVAEATDNQVTEHAHSHHTEGKCEFCDYMRVKRLLDHLNKYGSHGLGEATLGHLLRPRMDPTYNPSYEDYDYVHDNSFFTNTNSRDRGYFIIAPDWVSERKGIMSTHYQ
ncbi:hypothetical protein OS493_036807 [Desmophyllum pertusum]|uniref:Uncharacterized protein n=1 Tax=Desmophyllum pertusum TaxID=174260 RepID=A0A9W9ZWS6_9CNID|nr:hypothetical protein OS493_036807 [Desmophyllum pertusum]